MNTYTFFLVTLIFGSGMLHGSYYVASTAENSGVIASVSDRHIAQLHNDVAARRIPTNRHELIAQAKIAAFEFLLTSDDSYLRKVLHVGHPEMPTANVPPATSSTDTGTLLPPRQPLLGPIAKKRLLVGTKVVLYPLILGLCTTLGSSVGETIVNQRHPNYRGTLNHHWEFKVALGTGIILGVALAYKQGSKLANKVVNAIC